MEKYNEMSLEELKYHKMVQEHKMREANYLLTQINENIKIQEGAERK